MSTNRLATSFGGWLGMAAGTGVQALERLFYFFAIGAAILLVSAATVGRLSVLSLRDVRTAERRVGIAPRLTYARHRAAERRTADPARHDEHTGTEPPPIGPPGTTDGRV